MKTCLSHNHWFPDSRFADWACSEYGCIADPSRILATDTATFLILILNACEKDQALLGNLEIMINTWCSKESSGKNWDAWSINLENIEENYRIAMAHTGRQWSWSWRSSSPSRHPGEVKLIRRLCHSLSLLFVDTQLSLTKHLLLDNCPCSLEGDQHIACKDCPDVIWLRAVTWKTALAQKEKLRLRTRPVINMLFVVAQLWSSSHQNDPMLICKIERNTQ